MGAWESFHEDWRVYSLLETVTAPAAPVPLPDQQATVPERKGQRLRVDHVTVHLSRELLDAVRVQACALGIAIHSASANVAMLPLVQASAEVPGDQPWIRYTLAIDAQATEDQLALLHRRVQTTCVRRLENEYEAPIAGNVINICGAVPPER